jgi:hypothetical protein
MQPATMTRKASPMGNLVLLLLGIAGLLVFVLFYDRAFPTASIDLKVTRGQAQQIAQGFLQERGFKLAGYDTTTTFGSDEMAAVYLQRTQGMERANELMKTQIPVWFWHNRWFKPLQKEELGVAVDPTGKVIRFRRALEEDAPGANLSQAAAARIAENLITQVMKVDLSAYERVEASSEKRKKRTDHHFVWKQKGFKVADGEMRMAVDVQGDRVGHFTHFFKVPESFGRDYEKETSSGSLMAIVSLGLTVILYILAFVVFLIKFKAGDIRWKFGLISGGILLVLFLASGLNSIPLMKSGYPTQIPYGVFLATAIIAMVIGGLLYGALILLAGASGDALTREVYPESVATLNDLLEGRFARGGLLASTLRGYALAFLFAGYVVLFYLVGRRWFGVWLPADSPYNNMLNTALPFLFPLLVGFMAAISEEFTYRFFAIPLLKKYLKATSLALLVPAVIWAFAHSTYPVFPVYMRGIELTIGGLIFGWFFLRYGLVTCVVAHYALDALLVGLPLLRSSNSYYLICCENTGFRGAARQPVPVRR